MFTRFISLLGAIAATAATVAFASPAAAQTDDKVAVVSFAGLDLAKPADAARLDNRLRAAARDVCGPDQANDIRLHRQAMECQKEALSRANADVRLALRGTSGTEVALTTK